MLTGHRPAAVLMLSLSLGLGTAITGCGSSPGAAASAGPSATKTHKPGSPLAAGIIDCLNGHGMTLPAGATAKQAESAFRALPLSQRQRVYNACESQLPAKFRQKIQARLTATPSAT
jgi:hypothetical protein